MLDSADAEAPDFDQSSQFASRTYDQISGACVEVDTVVADQNGRRNLPGAAGEDQIEGEARLAGAGGTADQHGALADQDGRGVHRGRGGHCAGSLTTKCAPATVGWPSSSGGPVRFTAQMRPPCASTICLEIDTPSPEFRPKPWCGLSV